MKQMVFLAALLLAAPANAAVVRFDFISEVSVYDPNGGCTDPFSGYDEAFCLGKEGPINGQFVLDVADPDAIDFAADWQGTVPATGIAANIGSAKGLLLSELSGGGCHVYCELIVRSLSAGQYDISLFSVANDPDYFYGNDYASWGGAIGMFYSATGYWTATVVEPAPIPLPTSGILLMGALGLVALRRRR